MNPRGTNILFACFIGAVFLWGLWGIHNLRENYKLTLKDLDSKWKNISLSSPYLDQLDSLEQAFHELNEGLNQWEKGRFRNSRKRAYLASADVILRRDSLMADSFASELYIDSISQLTQERLALWASLVMKLQDFEVLYPLLKAQLAEETTDGAQARSYFLQQFSRTYKADLALIQKKEAAQSQKPAPSKKKAQSSPAKSKEKTYTQTQLNRKIDQNSNNLERKFLAERKGLVSLFSEQKALQVQVDNLMKEIEREIEIEKLGSPTDSQSASEIEKISANALQGLNKEFEYFYNWVIILGAVLILVLILLALNLNHSRREIKSREDFVSKVSHEIKNTLHPIIGYATTLEKTIKNHESRKMIWTINEESQNLLRLANGILDLSKITRNEFELEIRPFVLKDAVDQVISSHSLDARNKHIQLLSSYEEQLPKAVKGDPVRLKQILRNLVSNAIKHTDKGAVRVDIKLQRLRRKKAFIEFIVSDSGKGMNKKDLRKISRFNRHLVLGDNTQGHGFGLAISHQLIRQHKGKLKIRSNGFNKGVKVQFTLPYELVSVQEIPALPATSHPGKQLFVGKRILIVDDDPVNLDLNAMWLESYGVQVQTATGGKIGQRILKSQEFDLVLADIQMPDLDGVKFVQWLREKRKDQTPVIICSAESLAEILSKVKTSGANGFLPKPYNQEELTEKIAPYLGTSNDPLHFTPKFSIMDESPSPNSHTAYAIQKLQQELKGNQKAVDKKIRLLIRVCYENIDEIKKGLNKKDIKKVNRGIHKMLMICLYLGKDFVQQQADLDEMTKQNKFTQDIKLKVEDFVSKVGQELNKLENYTNYSSLNS